MDTDPTLPDFHEEFPDDTQTKINRLEISIGSRQRIIDAIENGDREGLPACWTSVLGVPETIRIAQAFEKAKLQEMRQRQYWMV